MDAKQTEFFRSLLTDRLSRLKEEAVKTRGDLTQEQETCPILLIWPHTSPSATLVFAFGIVNAA